MANPAKTNVDVNRALKSAGFFGKGLAVLAVAGSVERVSTSDNMVETTVVEASGLAGAVGGGQVGASVVAGVVGFFGGGPVGTAIGAFFGGLGGSIMGGNAAAESASFLIEKSIESLSCSSPTCPDEQQRMKEILEIPIPTGNQQ